MMKKMLPPAALLAVLGLGCGKTALPGPSAKFLIVLQADTDRHEGLARALHALLYAKELEDGGYPVTLVFDGAGTGWAELLRDPGNKLHAKYAELKKLGVVEEICDFCAGAFKVKDGLQRMSGANLVAEFEGHPSLKKWVDQGYQVVVL